MSSSISSIKTRIKSINSTKKITGAMKSVSSVKLNRMTKITLKNNEYKDALSYARNALLSCNIDYDSPYCKKNDGGKNLYFVFSSDVGLCGSYNESIISYIKKNVSKDDLIFLFGTSIYNTLVKAGFNIINDQLLSDNIDYYNINTIYKTYLSKFFNGEISSIKIIFNKYVNSITYDTSLVSFLPYVKNETTHQEEILLEPNPKEIFDSVIDLCLKSDLYNIYLNSKTSEQVARRFAMDNATNNAQDLIDNLTLEYNKARQGSITQEITEIVAGANAL